MVHYIRYVSLSAPCYLKLDSQIRFYYLNGALTTNIALNVGFMAAKNTTKAKEATLLIEAILYNMFISNFVLGIFLCKLFIYFSLPLSVRKSGLKVKGF